MTYAQAADVQNYLPPGYQIGTTNGVGNTQGVPVLSQVSEFVTLTSNEIDAAIASRGLAVPVAAPAWFVTELQRLNAQGAAALTLQQIFPLMVGQTPNSVGPGSTSLGGMLWSDYKKRLAEIRQGIGIPVAVATQENDLAPRGYLTDENAWGQPDASVTDEFGDLVYAEPAFQRGKRF